MNNPWTLSGRGDLWDSMKAVSSQSEHIVFTGRPFTQAGNPAPISSAA